MTLLATEANRNIAISLESSAPTQIPVLRFTLDLSRSALDLSATFINCTGAIAISLLNLKIVGV